MIRAAEPAKNNHAAHPLICLWLSAAGISGQALAAQAASTTVYTHVAAGNGYSCALAADGMVWCWGQSEFGIFGASQGSFIPMAVASGMKFKAITSGSMRVCGLTESGDAYCWGDNRGGALGARSGRDCDVEYVGKIECARQPLRVAGGLRFDSLSSGAYHTCGLSGGRIYCWGANAVGQLGDGSKKSRSAPAPVLGGYQFTSVDAAGSGSCGRAGGYYYCWGLFPQAPAGNSGNGFSAVAGRLDGSLADVIAGFCGLSLSGTVTCRGELLDAMTRIGVGGASVTFDKPKFISLSSGSSGHACGLGSNGLGYCWNPSPDSGVGGPLAELGAPRAVSDNLQFKQIATGFNHTCGLTVDGQLYCWGSNSKGQLGDGTTQASAAPVQVKIP